MRAAEEHGFTLVELLVAMVLSVIVFGGTLTALEVFTKNQRYDVLRNETQDNARNTIDRIARELRNVAAPKGEVELPGALEKAERNAIVFQTIDSEAAPSGSKNTTNAMRVRYCLDDSKPENEVLWRQVKRWTNEPKAPPLSTARWTSCPDPTAGAYDSSSRMVEHVTNRIGGQKNRPLFVYGPMGATESEAEFETAPIISVAPSLYIDLNPSSAKPDETQLTSTISLRNANRQPLAAFTATEVNGHILLNASESRDPDGLALSYKWSEGTTEGETAIPSTAQQYETPLLVSKSTHTFWLTIADPGGLTATTKQKVTLK